MKSMKRVDGIGMSGAERDAAVGRILDAALPEPVSPISRLCEIARAVTPGMLVFGVEDCVFVAAISTLFVLVPAGWAAGRQEQVAVALFMAAPVFYVLVQALCTWKDVESETMAWRSTCRVTPCELDALRMLVFGAAAVVVCVPVAAFMWVASARVASFEWMLSVSCASLSVYAAMALALMRLFSRMWARRAGRGSRAGVALPIVAPPAVWLGGCAVFAMDPEFGNVVLGVPAVVFALVAVGAASLFVVQILQGLRVAPYDARPGSSPA